MNETLRALLLAWLALLGAVALAAPASAPGKKQKLTPPDQVPAGLAKSDWQGIRAAYEAGRHEFQPSPLTTDPIAQQAYLKASNTGADDWFGGSVAVSGDTVVVGAYREDSNATGVNGNGADNSAGDAGAAYVFVRSGTGWTQQAYLKASNTEAFDRFGESVSVSGDTVVVGAQLEASNATGVNGNEADNTASFAGAAYVFVRSGSDWTQQAYLKASNTARNDRFGGSVSVWGDTVVVGAYGEDSNATGVNGDEADNSVSFAGAAYVFVRSGSDWTQQAYLKASNTGAGDWFGGSVAVSGDTVVVGAKFEASDATGVNGNETDNSATWSGAAYVFVRNGATWSQQAYLKASNTDMIDRLGGAVAVSGDTVVVGAYWEASNATGVNAPLTGGTGSQADNSSTDAGAAYIFTGLGPVTPPAAGLTLRLAPGAGGERRFIATGIPGGAHRLQAAVTIAGPWTDVPGAGAAGTATANGELLLEDATPPSDTVFYRAIGP